MEEFVHWVFDNKQWLFSGAGLVGIAWVARLIFKRRDASSTQTIRSGDGSTNIQAGRDASIGRKTRTNAEEE